MQSAFWSITDIPGIQSTEIDLLQHQGINTTQDLLAESATNQDQLALASRLQLDIRALHKWVALADLARIPSVGCTYSGMLLHSGIISVSQLTQARIDRLHRQILRLQVATTQRKDLCPSLALIQQWIQEAKSLAR
ncbi:DUF4332 domain-containing protein [Gloeocapsa sp. PCC 73106]|uniref:DUF4332 domain-containing protein n=1 Tax=Gloeocapsa sp. PCC 73106 TaxID=102232 RepID=UPI0002ACAE3D|nr:DUF4332 domain-containing protein [Gloeocapsa sp. PCC 73106]ELR98880.1 hypothetical protein GLO73106DRAFT_00027180 [Gloeocapsa sp. PCC 73106]